MQIIQKKAYTPKRNFQAIFLWTCISKVQSLYQKAWKLVKEIIPIKNKSQQNKKLFEDAECPRKFEELTNFFSEVGKFLTDNIWPPPIISYHLLNWKVGSSIQCHYHWVSRRSAPWARAFPSTALTKTTLLSLRWPQQWQVNISSWMDWDREPMKTYLSSRDSTESNAKDKNIPLHLKFLRKIHICAFAVLNFCQNFEKNGKHVPRIPFSLSDLVLALRRPPEYSTTGSFRKKSDQALLGGSRVSKSVDQEN